YQHPPLAWAKRGIGSFPDERVAKQRDGVAMVVHGGSLPEVRGRSPATARSLGASPAHHGVGKGALVLHSSRPPLAPAASRHGLVGTGVGFNRRVAATAATPIASTASPSGDPRGQT